MQLKTICLPLQERNVLPMWPGPPVMLRPATEFVLLPLSQARRPLVVQSPFCNLRAASGIRVSSWALTHLCPTHHSQHVRYSPSFLTVRRGGTQHPPPPHVYKKQHFLSFWLPSPPTFQRVASSYVNAGNSSLTLPSWLTPFSCVSLVLS